MNNMFKIGVASFALVAATSVFGAGERNDGLRLADEDAVGWTPLAIGIATPVQLPWGINKWDVFGLDVNVFYSDAPKMYGIDVGGLGAVTRGDMGGLQVGGLINFAMKDVYGIRATFGGNIANGTVYGADFGGIGFHRDVYGLEIEFLGGISENFNGVQVGGIANVTVKDLYGVAIAIGGNYARVMNGLQIGALFNMTEELHGCQIGLVNYAQECPGGFQIGLVNIIMENVLPVLPIFNMSF